MYDGNAEGIGRLVEEGKTDQRVQSVEPAQEENRADNVKIEMDEGGALCVLVCTRRGDQRRDGGADVLAHDDGHGSGVGDRAGAGQGLQDTDGRRRGL